MSKTTAPVRLSTVSPATGDLTAMEDIKGRDLLLTDAEPRTTEFGEGFLLTLNDPSSGEEFKVLTSAVVVTRQIREATTEDPFTPFLVNFQKSGRCWIIV